jgi:opacity protein-like surface antigen
MKKITFTIIFAFAISTFCFSQDFSKWQVGVTTSVGRSTYSDIGSFFSEKNLNLSTGFSLTYQMRYLFFETGVNYEYREHYYQYDMSDTGWLIEYDYDVTSKWLNLPLEIGVRYPTKNGNPYFVVRGYYNYLVKSDAEAVERYTKERTPIPWERFGKNQIGGQLGIGYQYAINDKWMIDLSYRISKDLAYFPKDYLTNDETDYTAQHIALRLKYNL